MAAQSKQRRGGPFRRRLKPLELGDGAGRGDLEAAFRGLERRPAQRLKVDQCVGGDLRRREQPGAAGKPCVALAPPGNVLGRSGPLDLGNGVQIHDRRLMAQTAGSTTRQCPIHRAAESAAKRADAPSTAAGAIEGRFLWRSRAPGRLASSAPANAACFRETARRQNRKWPAASAATWSASRSAHCR